MQQKKQSNYTDYNASNGVNDNFGTIYAGMCKSDAFKSLNISLRFFYVVCRVQSQSKEGRQCLYRHCEEEGTKYDHHTHFVFPASHIEEYGYDRRNAFKYLNELANAGFIEKVENNKHRKKVNVYRFVSKWKDDA